MFLPTFGGVSKNAFLIAGKKRNREKSVKEGAYMGNCGTHFKSAKLLSYVCILMLAFCSQVIAQSAR
ncbi:MAG TPA: hypothetical protein VGJ30_15415, partial [Candidatus Angelobacter sp.]